MMKILKVIALFVFSVAAFAKVAPSEMKEFNKTCPAPKLCETTFDSMEICRKAPKNCDAFLVNYGKLLPEYDCQRSFDRTKTTNYIVPAIWLCENHEEMLGFLSRLKTRKAQRLFGSSDLRKSLDGELAENYRKKSIEAELYD
jgi:hypothetical protein